MNIVTPGGETPLEEIQLGGLDQLGGLLLGYFDVKLVVGTPLDGVCFKLGKKELVGFGHVHLLDRDLLLDIPVEGGLLFDVIGGANTVD
jgi:hypothetical protein